MTKRAKETKRTKITTIAVIISVIVAIIVIVSARSSYLASRPIGGEIMFVFLPFIVYEFCETTTLAIDVFGKKSNSRK